MIIDSDASWFNNTQFRIHCSKKTSIFISLVSLAGESENAPIVHLHVLSSAKSSNQRHIWDCATNEIVATGSARLKGQEASIWRFTMDPKLNYHIIPSAGRRTNTGILYGSNLHH